MATSLWVSFLRGAGGIRVIRCIRIVKSRQMYQRWGRRGYLFFKACGYLAVMMGGGWITDGFVDIGEKGM